MYNGDLAVNNLQWLIYHKIKTMSYMCIWVHRWFLFMVKLVSNVFSGCLIIGLMVLLISQEFHLVGITLPVFKLGKCFYKKCYNYNFYGIINLGFFFFFFQKIHGQDLDYRDLGFLSVIELVSKLKSVRIVRPTVSGDWLLFDTQKPLDTVEKLVGK